MDHKWRHAMGPRLGPKDNQDRFILAIQWHRTGLGAYRVGQRASGGVSIALSARAVPIRAELACILRSTRKGSTSYPNNIFSLFTYVLTSTEVASGYYIRFRQTSSSQSAFDTYGMKWLNFEDGIVGGTEALDIKIKFDTIV
jgi:hypothetical protein